MNKLNLPISIPLSDIEMSNHIKIVLKYDDFIKLTFDNIYKSLPIVILYETGPDMGHWTLLHKLDEDNLEFFDSYGIKPDQEFNHIKPKYKQPHILVDFLIDMSSKYNINYNQYQLQDKSPSVSTCGRWVILRNKCSNIDIDTFANNIFKICNQINATPDELVTFLIQN